MKPVEDHTVVLRPGFQSKKRLFTAFSTPVKPCCFGIFPRKTTATVQPPPHRNCAGRSSGGCPGATAKHGNHKNSATSGQCCSPHCKGHNSVSGGERLQVLLQPTLSTKNKQKNKKNPPCSSNLAPCDS